MTDRIDEIAVAYVKIREQRKALAAKFKDDDKPLKDLQEQLEIAALARLDESGIQSVATKAGPTVYVTQTDKFSVGDRETLTSAVLDNPKLVDIFGNTLSKEAIKNYVESSGGELPPGVKQFTERHARFRS